MILDQHEGTIVWDGSPRTVRVTALDPTALIGMALLAGHDLFVRVQPGGQVRIDIAP